MSKVTITRKRYNELRRKEREYEALRAAGVDNWDGWEFAQSVADNDETYEEIYGEDDEE